MNASSMLLPTTRLESLGLSPYSLAITPAVRKEGIADSKVVTCAIKPFCSCKKKQSNDQQRCQHEFEQQCYPDVFYLAEPVLKFQLQSRWKTRLRVRLWKQVYRRGDLKEISTNPRQYQRQYTGYERRKAQYFIYYKRCGKRVRHLKRLEPPTIPAVDSNRKRNLVADNRNA